mmetsp:Transcript_6032/g.12960  ORF Transcript_6032/g.12960 Transcript_6032/m.12960 type:complete len:105 (+) Transcript_6032:187-501(+)
MMDVAGTSNINVHEKTSLSLPSLERSMQSIQLRLPPRHATQLAHALVARTRKEKIRRPSFPFDPEGPYVLLIEQESGTLHQLRNETHGRNLERSTYNNQQVRPG